HCHEGGPRLRCAISPPGMCSLARGVPQYDWPHQLDGAFADARVIGARVVAVAALELTAGRELFRVRHHDETHAQCIHQSLECHAADAWPSWPPEQLAGMARRQESPRVEGLVRQAEPGLAGPEGLDQVVITADAGKLGHAAATTTSRRRRFSLAACTPC